MKADDFVTVLRTPVAGEQLYIRVGVSSSEPHSATRMELVTRDGDVVAHAYWGETLCRWAIGLHHLPEPIYGGRVEMS